MDVQYVVGSAVELGEITALECSAIYLTDYGQKAVQHLLNSRMEMPNDFLQNTAQNALQLCRPERRHWIALNSLPFVKDTSRFIKERAEHLIQKKIQSDLGQCKPFSLWNELAEDRNTFFELKMVENEEAVTETTVRAILGRHMGGFFNRLAEDNEKLEKALVWYQADGGEQFRAMQKSHSSTSRSVEAFDEQRLRVEKRIAGQNKRPVRGAIKKICKLFSQFKQEDNLRLFVSGQEVELSHPDSKFKFILRPLGEPGWLEARSAKGREHTPYDLSLLTKDDIFVSKLCVYFTDTPVLDQLLAMSLFVQSGDELSILEKANFYSFGSKFSDTCKQTLVEAYPSLINKFTNPISAEGAATKKSRHVFLEKTFLAEEEHWVPFKGRIKAWVNTCIEPLVSPLLLKADILQIAR